jgi:hypothetical protein
MPIDYLTAINLHVGGIDTSLVTPEPRSYASDGGVARTWTKDPDEVLDFMIPWGGRMNGTGAMNEDDIDPEMLADISKIRRVCRDFNEGKITRAECRRKLLEECRVADHNLDMLLDAYDRTIP